MANDRAFQYCAGFSGAWNDDSPEKKHRGAGSECSGGNLLLYGSYGTGNFWRKHEIRISVFLRYDWFCLRGGNRVATGTTANAIGVGGLPGILSIKAEYMGNFALAMLVAIVVPLLLTLAVGKKKLTEKETGRALSEEAKGQTKKSQSRQKPGK